VRAEKTDGPITPRLLTVAEAAQMLNVSRAQMFRILKAKQLPVLKIGRLSRIRPEAVEEYIARLDELSRSAGSRTFPRVA
jgi:excisionase family DNA binding protein